MLPASLLAASPAPIPTPPLASTMPSGSSTSGSAKGELEIGAASLQELWGILFSGFETEVLSQGNPAGAQPKPGTAQLGTATQEYPTISEGTDEKLPDEDEELAGDFNVPATFVPVLPWRNQTPPRALDVSFVPSFNEESIGQEPVANDEPSKTGSSETGSSDPEPVAKISAENPAELFEPVSRDANNRQPAAPTLQPVASDRVQTGTPKTRSSEISPLDTLLSSPKAPPANDSGLSSKGNFLPEREPSANYEEGVESELAPLNDPEAELNEDKVQLRFEKRILGETEAHFATTPDSSHDSPDPQGEGSPQPEAKSLRKPTPSLPMEEEAATSVRLTDAASTEDRLGGLGETKAPNQATTANKASVEKPLPSYLSQSSLETSPLPNTIRTIRIRLPISEIPHLAAHLHEDSTVAKDLAIDISRKQNQMHLQLSAGGGNLQDAVGASLDSLVRRLAVDNWQYVAEAANNTRQEAEALRSNQQILEASSSRLTVGATLESSSSGAGARDGNSREGGPGAGSSSDSNGPLATDPDGRRDPSGNNSAEGNESENARRGVGLRARRQAQQTWVQATEASGLVPESKAIALERKTNL